MFSLAPLLVAAIGVAGLVLGEEAVRGQLVAQIAGLVGEDGARAIEDLIAHAGAGSDNVAASLISLWLVVRERLLSMSLVLAIGFLLLVSLLMSAGVGKVLIGLYLGRASLTSTFGAAASLIVVFVWVYYSAPLVFLAAELTQVIARAAPGDACLSWRGECNVGRISSAPSAIRGGGAAPRRGPQRAPAMASGLLTWTGDLRGRNHRCAGGLLQRRANGTRTSRYRVRQAVHAPRGGRPLRRQR